MNTLEQAYTDKIGLLNMPFPSSIEVVDNQINIHNIVNSKAYSTLPVYNFWKGWWVEEPRNIVEKTLKVLWEKKINTDDFKNGGIEYWTRCFKDYGSLEWHQDTCENHYLGKEYLIAGCSQVYYVEVSDDLEGGYFEAAPYRYRLDLKTHGKEVLNLDSNKIERIKPKEGRCIFMDSAQMHRVTKIYKGTRKNLTSSLWQNVPDFYKECENWDLEYDSIGKHVLKKVDWKDKYSMEYMA